MEAAAPGPWTWKDWAAPSDHEHWTLQAPPHARDGGPSKSFPNLGLPILQMDERDPARARDHEFIAHARTDVPELVAEVRRLRGLLEADGHGPDCERVNGTAKDCYCNWDPE